VAQQLTDGARAVHAAEAALHAGLTEDSTECPRVTHPRDGDLGRVSTTRTLRRGQLQAQVAQQDSM
jgi:hypothetical protein